MVVLQASPGPTRQTNELLMCQESVLMPRKF